MTSYLKQTCLLLVAALLCMLPADADAQQLRKDAASIAKKAGVKKLLIGHFSARYEFLEPLLEEARSIFPDTCLATDGKSFEW